MAPLRYYLFHISPGILQQDPQTPHNYSGNLDSVKIPREVYDLILSHLWNPLSEGAPEDTAIRDETLADFICLALTCKDAAKAVLSNRWFNICDYGTKTILWREPGTDRGYDAYGLCHACHLKYPPPESLSYSDRRRREWLRDLGGRRLGKWVGNGRRRGTLPKGLAVSFTTVGVVLGMMIAVLLGQL